MNAFREGYDYIKDNAGDYVAANRGEDVAAYVDTVENEIQNLLDDLNAFDGTGKGINFLKGDVAEFWHADTYNVDAAINKSSHRMSVPRSNELGSVDVQAEFDSSQYSLKYYKDGEASAKAQATSMFEASHGAQGSKADPLYDGQYRLIPKEQISDAEEWLKRKIAEESVKRPEQAARYEDTLRNLRDRIADSDGNESIPLTEEESRAVAELAKSGDADKESLAELLNMDEKEAQIQLQVIQDICKAGLTAATISLVLKTAPELFAAFEQLVHDGELDEGQLKKIGSAAVSGGAEGFLRGSISASITACCKSGLLGEAAKDINPAFIGAATVIAFDTMKNAFAVASGKKQKQEMVMDLVKEIYVSAISMTAGGLTQGIIHVPVLGYMIGSFLGSTLASFTFDYGYKTAISFSVDTGFTFFGVVDQDYELPKEVIDELGIDVLEYESFEAETFEPESFEVETFTPDTFTPESLDIVYLRRGVIGVNKVGYIA